MKWYKHDPDAFEAGTIELTLEETGAYILIINKLYSRDGDFPNSDYFGSRVLRCRPQTWRRLRDCLIAKGKLHVLPNGKLTANRVQTEVQTALKLIGNMRVLGRVSAKKRNKNKADTPTGPLVTTTSTPTVEKEAEASFSPERKVRRRSKSEKTSLPENWHPELAGDIEFEKFCDHARAQARTCANWDAALRNWRRNAPRFNGGNGNGQSGGRPAPKDDPKSIRGAFDRLFENLGGEDRARELARQAHLRLIQGRSGQ